MYKISIWLKGGGKIVEECDVNENEIDELVSTVNEIMLGKKAFGASNTIKIKRNPLDEVPICINGNEIAAVQIDENKKKEYHGRRLESNSYS
jgi:hypothetical protein